MVDLIIHAYLIILALITHEFSVAALLKASVSSIEATALVVS